MADTLISRHLIERAKEQVAARYNKTQNIRAINKALPDSDCLRDSRQ
jgi:hypothetical protein